MMTAEQLKASILQMAMQGKLVEQRAGEGTGEELLKTITKKFDTPKTFSINEEEITFEIPESWAWTKVGNVTILYNGRAFKPSDWTEDGLPIVRIQNLNDENAPFNRYNGVFDEEYHLYGEELLFAWSGTPGTSFGAHIWRRQEAVLNQHIFRIEFPEKYINKKYFAYALNFQVLNLIRLAHGSAGLQHVTKGNFQNTLIPLPPLEEQKRIVAKIEELMPFVEQYAKASTRLNTLNASFPDQMKKSILQQAVMGKLVPQDPNDEPASVLLKKIAEEKQKLIKEGKTKKQKALPAITEEEIPFDIPESWAWVRLGELCEVVTGRLDANAQDKNGKYPFFTCGEEVYTTKDYAFDCDAIQLGGNNAAGIYKMHRFAGKFNAYQRVYVISGRSKYEMDYIYCVIKFWLPSLRVSSQGTTTRFIKLGQVTEMLVPYPPVNEQKRIVEKLSQAISYLSQMRGKTSKTHPVYYPKGLMEL